jgi:crotonobetainyl-CoA:carnitine CoA-transferase CaiB-like acyl-CoA transferase
MQHLGELIPLLQELTASTTVEQLLAGAEEHDVPASKVNTLADLPGDPQTSHNQVFVEREHPAAGRIREPRPAPRFSATPAQVGGHAPRFGEHSDDIVTELGFDAAALRAAGVIH